MSDDLERFDDALRELAERPTRRSPAQAAQSVRTIIQGERRRRGARWSMLAAAAALAAAVGVTVLWQPGAHREPVLTSVQKADPGLAEGVVLMWLDEETPLYMTFQLPGNGAGLDGVIP